MEEDLQNWQALSESRKVDVSKKGLKSLRGIGKCKDITWLNISDNELESLPWLKKLRQLNVLKASNNKIKTIHHLAHLEELKALILNNNNLKSVEGIEKLSSLNALVLSHNEIEKIDVSSLAGLSKLSLSHNNLREIPDLKNLVNLKELRLNDNMIETIPEFLAVCKRLKLVDLGNNKITSLMRIIDVLGKTRVENLNLKGNEVCLSPDYKEKVISSLPTLRILDGQHIKQPEMQPEQASTKKTLKDDGSSGNIERKLEKDEADDSERKGNVLKTKDKTLKTGGFKSKFVTEKSAKESVETEAKRSKVKKKKHKVVKRNSNCKEMAGDEKISSEITSSKVKVVMSGRTLSHEKHAKSDTNVTEEKGGAKEQRNKPNKEGKRKRKLSEFDEITVEKKRRRKHSKNKSSNKSSARERKGETGENGHGVSGSLNERDTLQEKLGEGEVVAKRRKKPEGEVGRKIKKNSKKDKIKGKRKQPTTQADKRSGVLAVEVVKSKVKKKVAERGHLFEKEQSYNFGTGDNAGW